MHDCQNNCEMALNPLCAPAVMIRANILNTNTAYKQITPSHSKPMAVLHCYITRVVMVSLSLLPSLLSNDSTMHKSEIKTTLNPHLKDALCDRD